MSKAKTITLVNPNLFLLLKEMEAYVLDGYEVAKNGLTQLGVLWELKMTLREVTLRDVALREPPLEASKTASEAISEAGQGGGSLEAEKTLVEAFSQVNKPASSKRGRPVKEK